MRPIIACLVVGVALFFGCVAASSASSKCTSIKDDKERLACFDKESAPSRPQQQTAKTSVGRANYARVLAQSFLEKGIDIQVFAEEHQASGLISDPFPTYPRLTLFGYFNAPLVYQFVAAGLLANAKDASFSGVFFITKGPGGFFEFNLSDGTGCDVSGRICAR
jgi:hypothetical protein